MGRSSTAKEKLIEISKKLIWQNSYDSISVDRICQEANVNKGSFYYFFKTKESLVIRVIDSISREIHDFIVSTESLPLEERLEAVILFFIKMQRVHQQESGKIVGCPFGNLAVELGYGSEAIQKKVNSELRKLQKNIEEIIKSYSPQGIRDNRKKIKQLSLQILALWQGGMVLAKTYNSMEILEDTLWKTKDFIKELN